MPNHVQTYLQNLRRAMGERFIEELYQALKEETSLKKHSYRLIQAARTNLGRSMISGHAHQDSTRTNSRLKVQASMAAKYVTSRSAR